MTPTEQVVAATVSEALRVRDLTPSDDIFELGGDSLQAVQVALRLELHFDVDLPIESLEASACIRDIAALIDEQLAERAPPPASAP